MFHGACYGGDSKGAEGSDLSKFHALPRYMTIYLPSMRAVERL